MTGKNSPVPAEFPPTVQILLVDPRAPMRDLWTHLERMGPWSTRPFPDIAGLGQATLKPRPRLVLLSTWRLGGHPRAIIEDIHRLTGDAPVVVLRAAPADAPAEAWRGAGAAEVMTAPIRLRELHRVLESIARDLFPGAFAGRPAPAGGNTGG